MDECSDDKKPDLPDPLILRLVLKDGSALVFQIVFDLKKNMYKCRGENEKNVPDPLCAKWYADTEEKYSRLLDDDTLILDITPDILDRAELVFQVFTWPEIVARWNASLQSGTTTTRTSLPSDPEDKTASG